MRLGMLVDPKGKVPVKVVSKTFASGKTEKLVYQCLADLGLPSGKVSCNNFKWFYLTEIVAEVKLLSWSELK